MAYNFSLYNVLVSGCKHVRKHVLPFTYPVSTMSTVSANKVVERVTRDFRKIGISLSTICHPDSKLLKLLTQNIKNCQESIIPIPTIIRNLLSNILRSMLSPHLLSRYVSLSTSCRDISDI